MIKHEKSLKLPKHSQNLTRKISQNTIKFAHRRREGGSRLRRQGEFFDDQGDFTLTPPYLSLKYTYVGVVALLSWADARGLNSRVT